MKKIFLLFSVMLTISCGIFLGENPRSFVYKMENGVPLPLSLSENRFPFTERRTLIVRSGGEYPLKGTDCENAELRKFSDKVWAEVVKNNDLSGINSASVQLQKEVVQSTPKFCYFKYFRENSGEWTGQE